MIKAGLRSVTLRSIPAALLLLAASITPASGQVASEGSPEPLKALRVCQDPNNLPFSNEKGEGIENRIAQLFAGQLNVPVQYYSFPQRMAFVRNTLRYKLPGEDYRCDVILGVPDGYGQTSTTKPYYRSTYALIARKGGSLDGLKSGSEFLAKVQAMQPKPRIGLYDKSPGSEWLAKHGHEDAAVVYPILNADPEQFPGEIIARDLARGNIDVALVWGPIAGYYAGHLQGLEFNVVPLKSEPGVRFDYAIAMGVRFGEPAWKAQIQKLIDANQGGIQSILKEYGVPLVDDQGELLK